MTIQYFAVTIENNSSWKIGNKQTKRITESIKLLPIFMGLICHYYIVISWEYSICMSATTCYTGYLETILTQKALQTCRELQEDRN